MKLGENTVKNDEYYFNRVENRNEVYDCFLYSFILTIK